MIPQINVSRDDDSDDLMLLANQSKISRENSPEPPMNSYNNGRPGNIRLIEGSDADSESEYVSPMKSAISKSSFHEDLSEKSFGGRPTQQKAFGGNYDNDNESDVDSYVGSEMSSGETRKKKRDYLRKIERYRKRLNVSYISNHNLTMDDDITTIKDEFTTLRHEELVDNSQKMIKNGLIYGTKAVEWANNTFDPVSADLEGWSLNIKTEVDDGEFDSVTERLADKYAEKMDMSPEVELLFKLGVSAVNHHITKVALSGFNLGDKINATPSLQKDIAAAVSKHHPELQQHLMNQMASGSNPMAAMQQAQQMQQQMAQQMQQGPSAQQQFQRRQQQQQMMQTGELQDPGSADDILSSLGLSLDGQHQQEAMEDNKSNYSIEKDNNGRTIMHMDI